jgi:hypothetical protein
MINLAMCLAAMGLLALSLESVGAAFAFFGLCGWLIKLA